MLNFKEKVLVFVSLIPKGRVVSYGQVAAACGQPRAARQVGGILRSLDDASRIPWWRVVNSEGEISIKGNRYATKEMQRDLLARDGVEVDCNLQVEMSRYRLKKIIEV